MNRTHLTLFVLLACLGFGVANAVADTALGAVAVSAGGYHSCALTTAGGVQCWGNNGDGELGNGTATASLTPVPVTGLSSGVSAVSAGGFHTCALTTAGGVLCWGFNDDGELGDGTTTSHPTPVPVSGLASGVVAISAGTYHTCAITAAGAVLCWGYNGYGGLGDGTATNSLTPVAVSGLASGVASISAGGYHTCAVTSAGLLKCWGGNWNGQLGGYSYVDHWVPGGVGGIASLVAAVAAGYEHTCALTTDGAVKCWGYNGDGQLGDGTSNTTQTPRSPVGLPGELTRISAGGLHNCALTAAGAMWCWGNHVYGQLGDTETAARELLPVPVSGLPGGAVAMSAGYLHTCAVTPAGGVRCWGDNEAGGLGDGTITTRKTPVPVVGFAGTGPLAMTTDASGVGLTSATLHGLVSPDGEATTASFEYGLTPDYGSTTTPQNLGSGTANAVASATVSGLACGTLYHFRIIASNASGTAHGDDAILWTDVCSIPAGRSAVTTGGYHTCLLTADGVVKCWGSNANGELGDGTTTNRPTPFAVGGLSGGTTAVAAGTSHTCALTTGGGVLCWGRNLDGQLGDGTTTERHTPVAVVGLGTGVIAIAAGGAHTCAVKLSGAAYCWGSNGSGQLGDGTTTNRLTPVPVSGPYDPVVALSAGSLNTCALTSAGGVFCWGLSDALGNGSYSSQSKPFPVTGLSSGALAAFVGGDHACAVTAAHGVLCWGDNYYGQVGDGTTTDRLTPVGVSGLSGGVVAVVAGGSHTCALMSVGSVWCWGGGTVGDGTTSIRYAPVAVSGLPGGVRTLAAAPSQMCAVTVAETVWCWGANYYGQLGDGTTVTRLTAVGVVGFGATTPTPLTASASSVTLTSAVLSGTVNPDGLSTTAWFEYAPSGNSQSATTPVAGVGAGTTPVAVDVAVSGLVCGTVYQFRLGATNGSGTLYGDYAYFTTPKCPPPTLTAVTPALGSTGRATLVRLTGTNFVPGMTVTFGGTASFSVTFVSPTEITAYARAHAVGLVDVVVAIPDGQAATLPQAFRYQTLVPADLGGAGKSDQIVFRGSTGEWWVRGQAGAVAFGRPGDIPVVADYNADGKSELAVYRPSTSEWIIKDQRTVVFGQSGDVPVPGDYNGDGKAEIAVFRPSTGEWLIEGQDTPTTWGMRGDIPVPADYSGEGITELAVFRPSTGTWYIKGGDVLQWGMWGDIPVPANYDGTGRAGIAVYRPSTGWWYVRGPLTAAAQWGAPGDVPVPLDLNGDGLPEFVVFRPSNGMWYSLQPWTGATIAVAWGQAGDEPVGLLPQLPARPALKTAGDFDQDGAADVTVFRPSTGAWYTLQSTRAYRTNVAVTLGQAGDIPVPGDYQGTGQQERAVYRPSTGQWLLEDGRTFTLGAPDDVPVPGDYDGDGITDIAVFTPGTAQWSILTGASGFTTLVTESWGAPGDVSAPGDYDGDGRTDFAVFTPATGVWSIRSSQTGAPLVTVPFGMSGDIPVQGDYDGDGKTDIAVYRPSTGYWYVLTSSSNWLNYEWHWWGAVGDVPVPGDYDGDGLTDVAVFRPSTGAWYVMGVMTVSGWGDASDVPVLRRQ